MLTANYSNFGVVDSVDTWAAMFDYIKTFALPPVPIDPETGEAQIIRGYDNEAIKPSGSQEFIVYTKLSEVRMGTPIQRFAAVDDDNAPARMTLTTLYQETFQVDFYGTDDVCNSRARSFLNFGFSDVGHTFLEPYGVSLINVGNVNDLTYTDESGLMIKRYMCETVIQSWRINSLDSSWLDAIDLHVIDVDAKYKPAQEIL